MSLDEIRCTILSLNRFAIGRIVPGAFGLRMRMAITPLTKDKAEERVRALICSPLRAEQNSMLYSSPNEIVFRLFNITVASAKAIDDAVEG